MGKPILSKTGKGIKLLRVKHARTFWQKAKGLMGVSPGALDYALIFHMEKEDQIAASIHMMFMRMPLDVVWLNRTQKIVDARTLYPWALNYTPKKPAQYVVEMPQGLIRSAKLKGGQIVKW